MLLSIDEVKKIIAQDRPLALAGDETTLKQLPRGNWIGGTIPYFMAEEGGVSTQEKIFVTEFPASIENIEIVNYDEESISKVYTDAPGNGFSLIIIPASSNIHLSFALNAPTYDHFATRPLIGWISGVHLDELEKTAAKVFNGKEGNIFDNTAVVMHITLPEDKFADIGIVNIFSQGNGDTLEFLEDGFIHSEVLINGSKQNLAEYVKNNELDIRFPLVADYFGIMVNVSFQKIDEETKKVHFYAPLFKGMKYRQAEDVGDYVKEFTKQMPTAAKNIIFSCNCILNYLYSELEGKKTGEIVGPITFGEVAYQLVNQTLAYLTIQDVVYEEDDDIEE
ncbi:MAG: hypothetical protein GF308_20150 [Candidatus Heimdallarchaeota archaeon]|nr:hypothetical protein [Candidatus Heimdallarchaeota archaeon]